MANLADETDVHRIPADSGSLDNTPWRKIAEAFYDGRASLAALADATVTHLTHRPIGNSTPLGDDMPPYPQEGTAQEIAAAVDDGIIPEELGDRLAVLVNEALTAAGK